LFIDASASMSFRGDGAPAPKYAFAALIAAALSKIAVSAGDRVSLDWFGGERTVELATAGGREAFELWVSVELLVCAVSVGTHTR